MAKQNFNYEKRQKEMAKKKKKEEKKQKKLDKATAGPESADGADLDPETGEPVDGDATEDDEDGEEE